MYIDRSRSWKFTLELHDGVNNFFFMQLVPFPKYCQIWFGHVGIDKPAGNLGAIQLPEGLLCV